VGGFTGGENQPRNESLVGVARLEGVAIPLGGGALSVAAQAAVGRDGAIAGRTYPVTFEGEGVLLGVDARFELGRLMVAGEYHRADWDPLGAAGTDSDGWFATAGWTVLPGHQAVARWDRYRALGAAASDYLVVGYSVSPSSAVQLLANWWAPLDEGGEPHRALVSLELRF
jgi:hypothetical protein